MWDIVIRADVELTSYILLYLRSHPKGHDKKCNPPVRGGNFVQPSQTEDHEVWLIGSQYKA